MVLVKMKEIAEAYLGKVGMSSMSFFFGPITLLWLLENIKMFKLCSMKCLCLLAQGHMLYTGIVSPCLVCTH